MLLEIILFFYIITSFCSWYIAVSVLKLLKYQAYFSLDFHTGIVNTLLIIFSSTKIAVEMWMKEKKSSVWELKVIISLNDRSFSSQKQKMHFLDNIFCSQYCVQSILWTFSGVLPVWKLSIFFSFVLHNEKRDISFHMDGTHGESHGMDQPKMLWTQQNKKK